MNCVDNKNNHTFGLLFERFSENSCLLLKKGTPTLEPCPSLDINSCIDPNAHFIIEGENRLSLTALIATHQSKIDIIYIDPPYGTGKKSEAPGDNFIYNDCFAHPSDNDPHSRWLSFMEKRLLLAKKLLTPDGLIFISIGREELANLKLLCDSIFTDEHCLAQFVRRTKTTSFRGTYYTPRVDYILVYCNEQFPATRFKEKPSIADYPKIENDGPNQGKYYKDDTAFYLSTLQPRSNQRYFIECPDGELVLPPGIAFPSHYADGEKVSPNSGDGVWRWEQTRYLANKDYISFKKSKRSPLLNSKGGRATWNLYTKSFYHEKEEEGNVPPELLMDFLNRNGSEELKQYNLEFSYPKPSALIQYLIQISGKDNNAVVLDFFAGSGSTAEAVLRLNHLDGGNRQFILCNNNENNICQEITRERVKKASEKLNSSKAICYFKVKI